MCCLKKILRALKMRRKTIAIVFIMLTLLTLLPWGVSKPNYLGYYSICSFTPISTIILFLMALVFYIVGSKRTILRYATLIILILFCLVGFSAYSARFSIYSLQMGLEVTRWDYHYDSFFEDNVVLVQFNLTFKNPTGQDTPSFRIENYDFYINGKKLKIWTYGGIPAESMTGIRYFPDQPIAVKAHETFNYTKLELFCMQKTLKVEEGDVQEVWTALTQGNFSVTLTGTLVARSSSDYKQPLSSIIVAARPFEITCTYP